MIFQIDSEVVKQAYKGNNYRIEYSDVYESNHERICVLYFSSNEIYYPNTFESFEYSILKNDRYEWQNNKFVDVHKHIFIRDIQKQWYIEGINIELNNPIKLLDFLRSETKGYRIKTIGSSAGGFAAILFGSLLGAERIYALNAQLNLHVTMKNSNINSNPILFTYSNVLKYSRFYDLSKFISHKSEIYYFQSCLSKIDKEQFESLSLNTKQNIKLIRFLTSNHGFPFLKFNLSRIQNFNKIELDKLVNNTYHPITFSITLNGFLPTFIFINKLIFNRYKKKIREAYFKRINVDF